MTREVLIGFLSGGICVTATTAAWFFYRAWTKQHDALFLWFSLAFGLISLERFILILADPTLEIRPFFYLMRLVAFSLIIYGVLQKNLAVRSRA